MDQQHAHTGNPHAAEGFKTAFKSVLRPWKRCVAVRVGKDSVDVRDSKSADSPTLSFTHEEWDAFLDGARNGEFDLPA